jgi:hypothetical protein
MRNNTYPCFTSLNWASPEIIPGGWRPDRLRVVTGTFPEIVWATTRSLFYTVLSRPWGTRQYDSFIRLVHPHLECLAPEVGRIRHTFSADGTHGTIDLKRHLRLNYYNGPPLAMSLTPPPRHQVRVCRKHRTLRGTYHGHLPGCEISTKTPVIPPTRDSGTWQLSDRADMDCNEVCRAPYQCNSNLIKHLSFHQVVAQFATRDCKYYGVEVGNDMPCIDHQGICLLQTPTRFKCTGKHPLTRRLCPCSLRSGL